MTSALPIDHARGAALRGRLIDAIGAEHVLSSTDELLPYRHVKGPFAETEPAMAVRPGSAEEVQRVLEIANEDGVTVFARGNGFALAGFPPSLADPHIVLDTRRLDRIIAIDEIDMTVTAQCGVIMRDLQDAVGAQGFEVQTVVVPERYTTLGGVLSGVAGGGLPRLMATQGGTGQFLLGLTVVLPDGTLLRTNAGGSNVHRESSVVHSDDGPTLTPLFIGDGGLLGVKVEATLELLPLAPHMHTGAWMYEEFDQAWRGLAGLTGFRELPYSTLNATEGSGWLISFGVRTADESLIAYRMQTIRDTLARHGGRATGPDPERAAHEALALDRMAEADRVIVAPIFGKRAFPAAYRRLRDLLDDRLAGSEGLRLLVLFAPYGRHAVYTAFSIMYSTECDGASERAAEVATEAYRLVVELGGYPEPHQGVAAEFSAAAWSPEVRSVVERLKRLVDPKATLNRGLWGLGAASPGR
jgi:FAD/FMN-containing dehydrogenase